MFFTLLQCSCQIYFTPTGLPVATGLIFLYNTSKIVYLVLCADASSHIFFCSLCTRIKHDAEDYNHRSQYIHPRNHFSK